jgi:hypothetical protein
MAEQLPISTASNQQYGMRLAQQKAQQAVPMGQSPTTVSSPAQRPRTAPGTLTPLTAPTARPNEPITAGANFGAGPNAMGAGIMPVIEPADDVLNKLAYLNTMYPNPDLQNLINALRDGGQ